MQEQSEQNKKQKKVKKVSHLPALTRKYDKKDFESLCENEYFRFQNHAKKVGVIYFLDKNNLCSILSHIAKAHIPLNLC